MPILVTGVTGQVGGHFLRCWGRQVLSWRPIATSSISHNPTNGSVLSRIGPDLIINAAAFTAVDRAEDETEMAFRVNAEAPGAIAQWAALHNVPVIHFSTDYVFDGAGSRPWREDDPANPLSIYGASKLAGEKAVRSVGGPHLIVRTSWVYASMGTSFFPHDRAAGAGKKGIRVVADQLGAPTPARLIADALASIVGRNPYCLLIASPKQRVSSTWQHLVK